MSHLGSPSISHRSQTSSESCTATINALRKEYGLLTGAWLWDSDSKRLVFHLFARPRMEDRKGTQLAQSKTARPKKMTQHQTQSTRPFRRHGVITIHDIKEVALRHWQKRHTEEEFSTYFIPPDAVTQIMRLETTNELIEKLIIYFHYFHGEVALKRKFRFEIEGKHIQMFLSILQTIQEKSSISVQMINYLDRLRSKLLSYKAAKFIFPFPEEGFDEIDHISDALLMYVDGNYRPDKEKWKLCENSVNQKIKLDLSTFIRQRQQEKTLFQRELQELQENTRYRAEAASLAYSKLLTCELNKVIIDSKRRNEVQQKKLRNSISDFLIDLISFSVWLALEKRDFETIYEQMKEIFGLENQKRDVHGRAVSRLYALSDLISMEKSNGLFNRKASLLTQFGILGLPASSFNEDLDRMDTVWRL